MSPISSKTTVAQCYLGQISSNRKVVHGAFHKLWLPNNTGQFEAKRRLRKVFLRQFRATGQLPTMFCTSFSFLTKGANSKQNDSSAECFDANFEKQESGARCFPQGLPSKQNDSCADCFDANIEQKESCARSFLQALAS